MPGNTLQHTRQLLLKLREGEWETLQTFLRAFHQRFGDYEPLTLQLAQLLRETPALSRKSIQKKLGKPTNENTFRMLITRLRDKVFECLTLDINTNRPEAYSKHYQIKMTGRKWLSQAEILHGRGMVEQAEYLYDRTIRLAKRYEVFAILNEALRSKMEIKMARGYLDECQHLEWEIAQNEATIRAIFHARMNYYKLAVKGQYEPGVPLEEHDFLQILAQIECQMEYQAEGAKTPRPGVTLKYWYYRIRLAYLERFNHFSEAMVCCDAYILHLEKHRAAMMPKRFGTAYLYKTHYCVMHQEWENALKNAKIALRYFEKDSFNALAVSDFETRAFVGMGNYDAALMCINQSIQQTSHLNNALMLAQRKYYRAGIYFVMGKLRRAFFALRNTVELDKDKSGWNLHIRLLQIMIQIEWNSPDHNPFVFTARLHAFVKEVRLETAIPHRFQAILKALRKLEKHGFDFNKAFLSCEELLRGLKGCRSAEQWHPVTSEFIRFDDWFIGHLSKRNQKKLAEQNVVEVGART